ncbi:MAG: hypothetical protein RR444_03230 [Oscillospiraceae bacterium]
MDSKKIKPNPFHFTDDFNYWNELIQSQAINQDEYASYTSLYAHSSNYATTKHYNGSSFQTEGGCIYEGQSR